VSIARVAGDVARSVVFLVSSFLCAALVRAQPELPIAERERLNAVVWQQRALEHQANVLSVYRSASALLPIAKLAPSALAEPIEAHGLPGKPPAVVLDVDETVLDNSPYLALTVQAGVAFDERHWLRWVTQASAAALPGASEFIARARKLHVHVIFITNRTCNKAAGYDAQGHALDCPQKAGTLQNLERVLGYRPSDGDVLLKDEQRDRDDSDKRARRLEVARNHRVVMLVGDDAADFVRRGEYDAAKHARYWGSQWFALPNAVYGSWQADYPRPAALYAALDVYHPVPSARLQVLSWNLSWLADPAVLEASGYWTQCFVPKPPTEPIRPDLPYCDAYTHDGIRSAADYRTRKLEPLRARLTEIAAQGLDVLAVQETQSPAALQAVLPSGYEVACFTTRPDAQNLGFAVRSGSGFQLQCQELRSLSLEDDPSLTHPVRRGLELTIDQGGGHTLSLLNVHLKAKCVQGPLSDQKNANCLSLQRQVPLLEAWVEAQAARKQPFAIVGDWNRDLEAELSYPARTDRSDPAGPLSSPSLVQNLWPEIDDATPPESDMDIARVDRTSALVAPRCEKNLDQLVVSRLVEAQLTLDGLQVGRVPAALLPRPATVSDHCPLRFELRFF
jgi:acid phosphatase